MIYELNSSVKSLLQIKICITTEVESSGSKYKKITNFEKMAFKDMDLE